MELNAFLPVALTGVGAALVGAAVVAFRMKRLAASKAPSRSRRGGDAVDTLVGWTPSATRILTRSEREAYHTLRKALPDHMILAQVPLSRFLKVPTRNSYTEWLGRVGALCADLVVCDTTSQVVAVIEVRQPVSQEKERTQKRHSRMDKVLNAAGIPVHVWLEGAIPGATVARESVLGSAFAFQNKKTANSGARTRLSAEAAAIVAALQAGNSLQGIQGPGKGVDLDIDDDFDDEDDEPRGRGDRRDPPSSTWFDELDSGPVPLDTATHR